MNIYVYKNKKVGFFMPPFFKNEPPQAVATDQYRAIAIDPKKCRANHLEELEIYHLGEFDDIKCQFNFFDKPVLILDCQEVLYKMLEKENENNEG